MSTVSARQKRSFCLYTFFLAAFGLIGRRQRGRFRRGAWNLDRARSRSLAGEVFEPVE